MKIIALEAENIKRLKAVEIRPDGSLVLITGKNGQGKTSVLDAIWWALAGQSEIQLEPIREGADKARIKLDLGELIIKRTFNRKEDGGFTTSLIVESVEGARFPSPQSVVDELVGALSFDPLALIKMKPADQFDTVKGMVPGIDFDALAKQDKADFDRRTDINRRAKQLRAQADAIKLPPGATPKAVDVAELTAKITEASEQNSLIERRRSNRAAAQERLETMNTRVVAMRAELEELERAAKTVSDEIENAEALPPTVDTTALLQQLRDSQATNATADEAKRKVEINAEAQVLEDESKRLTDAMDEREEEKKKAIAAADMPVAGLSFGVDHLRLNGQPFEQASDAEQLRASIAIAGALNPRLRVIRVRDGSLLDEDALALLATYAEEHDLQVWLERVDSSGKVGFVLENGRLAGDEDPDDVEDAV